MRINKEHEKGPFDIIGDVHGCSDELKNLLDKLGHRIKKVINILLLILKEDELFS
ncbi:hypothetical protein [Rickettsia endosymbiont of Cantharis rufa]|uniref:hypothetical protein n=1 Tax=Rickettsia endosymbiont of Cantharis rufa TaxID=3066248 RepID=UPI00313330BA